MAPTVYTVAEAAVILKVTESWLKEQARLRKVPFVPLGSGYRWTDAHLDEIVRLREQRPAPASPRRAPARRAAPAASTTDAPVLEFREPRRKRTAA